MKRIIALSLFGLIWSAAPSFADDPVGGWVIVDAKGNQVGGVIVCTPSVCGDPKSAVSKDLLKEGQRFVQQTLADQKGNVAGIPATETTKIVVDASNTFTVQQITPVVVQKPQAIIAATQVTTTQFSLADTSNGVINAPVTKVSYEGTVTVKPTPTPTPVESATVQTPAQETADIWAQWLEAWTFAWSNFNFNFTLWGWSL